jgi:anti-sigma B factor antagonist
VAELRGIKTYSVTFRSKLRGIRPIKDYSKELTMEISIQKNTDLVTVSIVGDIEMMSIKDFKNQLLDIGQNEEKDIGLDLSKVNYIDSSGVGVLISLLKLQKNKGKNLKILKISPKVLNVLKLSSLSDIFNL